MHETHYPHEPSKRTVVILERDTGDEHVTIDTRPLESIEVEGQRWTLVRPTRLVNGTWLPARYRPTTER
ncbi:hypothetical protein HUN58_14730 [Curtobacterium sp. Csp1]|uniref:hypothetical protein n=1 Tax=Curtobacterium sp. Csp1 TaxID=2495429 RepID=UPI001599E6D8|nr:hypothetical protein [Curtobacterium sp. Csp1]QKS21009.1 hypothetical protein HUN58_14730 [Curtobacterium sp. Csp1]